MALVPVACRFDSLMNFEIIQYGMCVALPCMLQNPQGNYTQNIHTHTTCFNPYIQTHPNYTVVLMSGDNSASLQHMKFKGEDPNQIIINSEFLLTKKHLIKEQYWVVKNQCSYINSIDISPSVRKPVSQTYAHKNYISTHTLCHKQPHKYHS